MNSKECPICMEPIQPINCSITKCSHSFCTSCLLKNSLRSGLCPMCRTELSEDTTVKQFVSNKEEIIKRSLDAFNIVERFPDIIDDETFKYKIIEDFVYFSHLILNNSIDILNNN